MKKSLFLCMVFIAFMHGVKDEMRVKIASHKILQARGYEILLQFAPGKEIVPLLGQEKNLSEVVTTVDRAVNSQFNASSSSDMQTRDVLQQVCKHIFKSQYLGMLLEDYPDILKDLQQEGLYDPDDLL